MSWPAASPVDQILVQQSEFIHRAVSAFRPRRDAKLNPPKKKGAAKKQLLPPKSATIYVAKKYPDWMERVIKQLAEIYQVCLANK